MKTNQSIIDTLLNVIKDRPGLFLGKNHISLLPNFILGYKVALQNNGIDPALDPFFGQNNNGFFEWYGKKTGVVNTPSWYATILDHADDSEEKALELFFTKLEEFAKENNLP